MCVCSCCGNVSGYDTATPGGGPRGVPGLLVNNQVRMEGFVVYSCKSDSPGGHLSICSPYNLVLQLRSGLTWHHVRLIVDISCAVL
jgi:hypothetical protein